MSARLLTGLLIVALAGCKSGDALVVVTLTSTTPIPGIAMFNCNAMAGSRDGTFVVKPAAPISLSSTSFDFAVQVPTADTGGFTLTVNAIDAKGNTLATQHGSTTTSDGKKSTLALEFGAAPTGDGGTDSGSDGGTCTSMCNAPTTACGVSLACGGGQTITCPCHIDGITPTVAQANSTVTLEGNFAKDTQITFGGSNAVGLTLLGANRATVTLPNDAVTGPVAIAGTTTANAVNLKVSTYKPGIGIFSDEYMQNDFAHVVNQPLLDRSSQATLNVGGHVLLIGGVPNDSASGGHGAQPQSSFEISAINADGSLGPFTTDTSRTLVQARAAMTAVQLGLVYVIGGWDNAVTDGKGVIYGSIEEAQINGDGSGIQKFTTSAVSLVTPRYLHASKVIGSYLYVFGGFTSGSLYDQSVGPTATASIERAPINASGVLGKFETAMPGLLMPRAGASVEVSGNMVYVMGGFSGAGSILSSGEHAAVNGDGTLGPFTADEDALGSTPRAAAASIVLGGDMYLIGGFGGGTPGDLMSVVSTPIVKGGLGTFTASSPLTQARAIFGQPLIVGNELFVLGGGKNGTAPDVEHATLAPTATLGAFNSLTPTTTSPRNGSGAAIVGQTLFLFGGDGDANGNSIESAPINPDGSLGPFVALTTPTLAHARFNPSIAVLDGDIYVYGGIPDSTTPGSTEVFSVSGGTLSGTATMAASVAGGRTAMQLVATDGQLWALGGAPPTDRGVDSIPLGSDGTPTSSAVFMSDGSTALASAHGLCVGALIGGSYYLFGDESPVTTPPETDMSSTGTTSLVPFTASTIGQLGYPRSAGVLVRVGDTLNLITGMGTMSSGTMPNNSVEVLPITPDPTTGVAKPGTEFTTSKVTVNTARSSPVAAAVGNYVYIIGGFDSTNHLDLNTIEQAPLQ